MRKTELIRNYIKKFPNTPSTTLSKKIYAENMELFTNQETVRSLIRYTRGLSGKAKRKHITDEFKVKPFSLDKNPFHIPKSDAQKQSFFTLPQKDNNILLISDLHIPYHDIPALTCAIKYGKEKNVNTIFINGDLIDFYPISRFVNIERKRSVSEEIQIVKDILGILRREFPDAAFYFLMGNHDNRLETYLATKAPELLDVEEFRLEYLLDCDKYGVKIIKDNTLVRAGKLHITHGHLLIKGIFAPVNPARGAFLRAKDSILISHVHNSSSHTEKTIKGKLITCYSTGCLCELSPTYNPFGNNFGHGFAHITIEPNGHYKVDNKRIIDGEIY